MFRDNDMVSGLFICTVLLTLFGLIMIYSSSWVYSQIYYENSYYLLVKQVIAAVIGLVGLTIFSRINYAWLARYSEILLLITIALTAATAVPGLTSEGRWLQFGPVAVQPTELLKFSLILWVGMTLIRKENKLDDFKKGVLPFLIVFAIVALFILSQPDFSMTVLLGATVGCMLFVGGVSLWHLAKVFFTALPFLAGILFLAPYRVDRLISFLNPMEYSRDEGYQLVQSFLAIGSGGIFGRGLGQSTQKFLYLPSAYNDFIFSIIGEELGFIGAVILLSLFCYLGWSGFQVALNQEDKLGSLLAVGITFVLSLQAGVNLSVALGLLPVTGLPLPFVSYGGTSLVVSMAMVGTLINIARP